MPADAVSSEAAVSGETGRVAGRVWAHVGQPFEARPVDVAIVGAGRMGAACALALRQQAPQLSVLLIEQGGLPNEDGATLLAPGIWTLQDVPSGPQASHSATQHGAAHWTAQAEQTRAQLLALHAAAQTHNQGLQQQIRPLISLYRTAGPGRLPTREVLKPFAASLALIDPDSLPFATLDADAITYRPGAVAQAQAQAAVRAGAGLLLNTQAHLTPGGVGLDRLTVTNTHQIVTHESHLVAARWVIVAAGAEGPALIEQGLGRHTAHARAYRQAPRLNTPSDEAAAPGHLSPVLRADGLTLRPQNGGYTLVPPIHHRDPQGYQPTGGRLTGVPVGLRRETLEDLIAALDALPVLGAAALDTGRSLADIAGAWVALPGGLPDGPPLHEQIDGQTFLLLGGPLADTLGLAVASDLARVIAENSGL